MWTTAIDRDAHGHLRHVQVWTSIQPAGTVYLYFAHAAGIALGGQAIPDTNNFFFKHFLLPSKSGKTMQQKAESRVDHRFGAKQLALKVASGHAANKAWAQRTADFATQFVARLADPAYVATLPGGAAAWNPLRAPLQQALMALGAAATDDAKSGAVRKAIGLAMQGGNPKPMLDAFKDADDPARRAGIGWADKYGAILTDANTVVVLSDGDAANWGNAGGIIPITRQAAAQKFYDALLLKANAAGALPATIDATIDFGQVCVMSVTKGNQPAAWANASTMKVRARAISPLIFDVYHYEP
jgi:hypothetical protein